jgi:CHRD domain
MALGRLVALVAVIPNEKEHRMYRTTLLGVILAAMTVAAPAVIASPHQDHPEKFRAEFSGFNETGALNAESGAILSPGHGTLEVWLDRVNQTLTFELSFWDLSAPVTQSHIHFGKNHMAGGVMVFFCSNLATAPAGTQACPANGGTVSGTLTAANVLPIAGQNVTAGDFQALVDALESDTAYANIHTTSFPAGEIRGQVRRQ